MGITVTMYKNFYKRDNSTKQPQNTDAHTDFTCTLKAGTSVLDPVLEVLVSGTDPNNTPVGLGYNYAYIPKWNRYYFITDWKANNGLWLCYMHVDVLASYKTFISSATPYVLRAAANGNDDIVDTLYPATETWEKTTTSFTTQPFDIAAAGSHYVVGIISQPPLVSPGNEPVAGAQGCVTYYATNNKGLNQIMRYLMGDDFVQDYLADPLSGLTETAVKDFVDPMQYIESVRYYPYGIFPAGQVLVPTKPQLGWYDMSSDANFPFVLISLNSLKKTVSGNVSIPVNPNASGSGKGFLNNPPYVQYDLLFEPWGIIPLDASLMKGKSTLYATVDVDYVTGMARMALGTTSGGAQLGIYSAVVGVDISLSQITQDVMGATASLASGIVGTVGAALTGNLGGAITSAANGISSALDNLKPQVAISGANNSMLAYRGTNLGAALQMKYCDCVGVDPAECGRAYCRTPSSLGALSGYVKCLHGDIDMTGYMSEKASVKGYLEGGFFYE